MTDQDRKQTKSGDTLERVLQVLKEIAEKSADGDYLYRGEPKHYCRVSSSLYRRRKEIKIEGLDIEIAQAEMLKSAQEFAGQMDEDDLLAQLQHYGSVTNLIDFTTDYLIALYFACDGKPARDGRVILLKKSDYPLLKPKSPENRIIAQKSVFVRPSKGFIADRKIVTVPVPHDLKEPILEYLGKHHNLRAQTIYNDLHGFIRYQQGHESAYLEFYAGLMQQQRGEHHIAIENYGHAISLNPQLFVAYNNRGIAYSTTGDYNNAIKDHMKAIELNPNYSEAYNNLGEVYICKGDFDDAIRHCDDAIRLNPCDSTAYVNRGIAYKNKGEVDCAIQDFNRAVELSPNLAEAYDSRGTAYCDKGEYGRAIQDHDKAIELDPESVAAYTNRGVAYLRNAEYDRAIQDFNRALELDRDSAATYTNRGNAYSAKGDHDHAILDYNTAIELDPGNYVAFTNRGAALACKGEHDRAVQDYDQAIEINSSYATAHNNRGIVHWNKGNYAEGIRDFSKAIERNSGYVDAYYNRGLCWLHLSEWSKAEADLTTAKQLGWDISSAFQKEFSSVVGFEGRFKVKLPARILELLTANGDE